MPLKIGAQRFLHDEKYKTLRLGLATHPAAIMPDGEPVWRRLLRNGYNIGAFFGPEHGFNGATQDAKKVSDATLAGVPVYSLYGENLAPQPKQLAGLDALLFDMQDIGCRYYTYIYTLAGIMRVAENLELPLIVLDRPNPINGMTLEGGVIDEAFSSFVGGYGLIPRHGMTIGEIARYFHQNYFPACPLTVCPMEGWERRYHFDECGLPWYFPSPNLPGLSTALGYPGSCLAEGTTFSEGRGTTRPFEIMGAPWVNGPELADHLNARRRPGVCFSPVNFVPTFSKYKGELCEGIYTHITDRDALRPLEMGIHILHAARQLYNKDFMWKRDYENTNRSFIDLLAGTDYLSHAIDAGKSVEEIYENLCANRGDFISRREQALIYHS